MGWVAGQIVIRQGCKRTVRDRDVDPTTRRRHRRDGLRYGSDLTDAEFIILLPFPPPDADSGRKRAHSMREIMNVICYMLRGGIAPRLTLDGFPP